MKNLFLLPTLLVIITSFGNYSVDSEISFNRGDKDTLYYSRLDPDLKSVNPLQFLDSLKITHGRMRVVTLNPYYEGRETNKLDDDITKVPKDWITSEYIDTLIHLMDDTSQTIPVFSAYANLLPDGKQYTTVGIEAMRMVQGYKKNLYPSLWPEFYINDTIYSNYKQTKKDLVDWWKKNK